MKDYPNCILRHLSFKPSIDRKDPVLVKAPNFIEASAP